MRGLTVSEVAEAVGIHPKTVLNLERKGLIRSQRDHNGWRRFGAETVQLLHSRYTEDSSLLKAGSSYSREEHPGT